MIAVCLLPTIVQLPTSGRSPYPAHAQVRSAETETALRPDEPVSADVGNALIVPDTPEQRARNEQVARCLAIYFLHPIDADALRPWSIMHGLIGYGQQTRITSRGRLVDAVDYLCANQVGNDKRLLHTQNGKLRGHIGIGVQGHPGQFLAMLAQSDVAIDHPITVDGQSFTVADLVESEKLDCESGTELTFRLMGLAHYAGTDSVWVNRHGEQWSVDRLLREELAEPINDAACGGTHRIMAISFAVRQHNLAGGEFNTLWEAARQYVRDYHEYAFSLQNPDGSFSTEFFKEKGADPSAKKRLYTTGHILEWLVFSLPEEELSRPELAAAVDYLTALMLAAPGYKLDVGPRGHAIRALRLYQERTESLSDWAALLPGEDLQRSVRPVTIATHPESGSRERSGGFNNVPFRNARPFGARRW